MDSCTQVYAKGEKDIPEWAKKRHVWKKATDVTKLKKLEVSMDLCCDSCEERVAEKIRGLPGVFDFKADRFNELLTIYETPGDGPNHKQLLKKLRKVDKRARIVKKPVKDECSDSEPQRGHCMVLLPDIMTPWIPAGGMPVWPFFPNFHYVQHPVSCGHCLGYSDVVCSNCGRRSEVGALKE